MTTPLSLWIAAWNSQPSAIPVLGEATRWLEPTCGAMTVTVLNTVYSRRSSPSPTSFVTSFGWTDVHNKDFQYDREKTRTCILFDPGEWRLESFIDRWPAGSTALFKNFGMPQVCGCWCKDSMCRIQICLELLVLLKSCGLICGLVCRHASKQSFSFEKIVRKAFEEESKTQDWGPGGMWHITIVSVTIILCLLAGGLCIAWTFGKIFNFTWTICYSPMTFISSAVIHPTALLCPKIAHWQQTVCVRIFTLLIFWFQTCTCDNIHLSSK